MEVKGYENYIIYNDGDVYSRYRNRYLKHKTQRSGHKFVCLYKNKDSEAFRVHRLVALHYIPNPDNKDCVDHIDGNKSNNNVKNLRWTTHRENMNAFQKKRTNNTSGIKNISYDKASDRWMYKKKIFGIRIQKYFKTKKEAIWFKFTYELLNPSF